ncbi:MAG: type III-B CRISPR module RAMP protein Cmr1 [Desulfobacteria bacterium]
MKSMFIEIETLTPIWTGGVKGSCDILHETGIIGSMRWWYEAIVRGLGGNACDPTGRGCIFDKGEYDNAKNKGKNEHEALHNAKLCDVCQVFGATGWRRRFDLRIIHNNTEPAWKGEEMLKIRPPARSHGWFLSAGMVGRFTLKLQGDSDVIARLASLLLFLEEWGAIGAKPQLGYGFFKINNREEIREYAMDWSKICTQIDSYDLHDLPNLPDLRQFTFFRYRFKPSHDDWWTWVKGLQRLLGDPKAASKLSQLAQMGIIPVSPVLKNQWRYVEWPESLSTKRWIFGTSDQEKRRGKISISWAYHEKDLWVVRGWAWLPEEERIKSGTIQHRQEIDVLEDILKNELVWKKALNLDNNSRTDLYVESLTNNDNDMIIKILRGKT